MGPTAVLNESRQLYTPEPGKGERKAPGGGRACLSSPVPSPRVPLGKHKCVSSPHHQVRGGNSLQRLKSTCFWQVHLCHLTSHWSPAPRPGSRRCYCWSRQNKSPRVSLESEGNKNCFNSSGGMKKKSIEHPERSPDPSLLCAPPSLALPSKMCTNTSCGRSLSSAARR